MTKPVIRMKGGGNTNTYSQVDQTTTNLPAYAEPYMKDLLARTGFETAKEYQPYEGQRISEFSPEEQEAFYRYGQFGMSGTPEELNEAGRMAMQVGQGRQGDINTNITNSYGQAGDIGSAGDYNNQQRESGYTASQYRPSYKAGQREMGFEAGTMSGEALDPYRDQYMQDVVDIEKREAARQADMRHAATGLDAAGMGGLGGYREAIMRAEAERNLGQNMADIQTRGSQQAFLNAQRAFEADRQARAMEEQFGQSQFGMNEQMRQAQEQFGQSAFGMNEAARQAQEQFGQSQFGLNSANNQFASQMSLAKYQAAEQAKQQAAQLGLSAQEIAQAGQIAAANIDLGYDQNRLAAAGMLGDFAGQRQAMELERLGVLEDTGQKRRMQQQAGLDMAYQDFLRQQGWGKEQLAFYSDMLHGNQIKPGETKASYGDDPSAWQQALGGGIGMLGMYNAYNSMNQGGGG